MKKLLAFFVFVCGACAQMKVAALPPGRSPLVTFRVVFTTGSAQDPADKPGLAYLTAMLLANGGTKDLTYPQVVQALFPMAASISAQVDKEMTTFSGQIHVDNLDAYYRIFRSMLLDPGWREDDFRRVKDDAVNFLRIGLRGNNDEELGKEVLYQAIYRGTPYEHYSVGTVSSLEKLTLDDLKQFYREHYTQANLILGIGGGYSKDFLERMKSDFRRLPAKGFATPEASLALTPIEHNQAIIVDKDTRSVAYSLGFPIGVTRGNPDFPALLLVSSYLGQHRMGGRLFRRIREARGLNYGDYAYVEYFPRGMYLMEPNPNLARRSQIFQIWIRPLEPPTAHFALRLAMYELNRLVENGMSKDDFTRTRDFLVKYVNVLTRSQGMQLGYYIDSLYYGIPDYPTYIKAALAKLTLADVNRAIKRHLRADRLEIVAVSKNGERLKSQLTSNGPSPMHYNSPKPPEILDEDKVVETFDLHLRPEDVTVVPVAKVFE